MEALNKLKQYAILQEDWYILNKLWYIEKGIEDAINIAKIEVYETIEKNKELIAKNKQHEQ